MLVARVKELGMNAVAMTDHGTMSGTIEFYKACKAAGIKPIIGCEFYVAARAHTDREPGKDKARYHLIVLASNNAGYQNLMKLATVAHLEGFYYKPRIDHALLKKHNEGLIVLSGCASGEVSEAIKNNDYKKATQLATWYKSVFGDRYYLEIQDHNEWDVQININKHLLQLSKELAIPCVVTSDAHYLKPDDAEAHEILLCVGTAAYLSDPNRMSLKDFHLHVTDPKDIIERWGSQHPEIIQNTSAIAARCNVELELGKILIPTFPVPAGESEESYLRALVYRGLAWRYGALSRQQASQATVPAAKKLLSKEVLARAEYELRVIGEMGFNGYFLIIWDFMHWGKQQGIIFGPGRGSAAGSIIAYALDVTDLDPLKYDLLFERFLNPDRISMPDIDIDIQDTRRDEVIAYCARKYGEDRVANIVTFGTMAARAAVRDVARVLEMPYAEADRLAKLIPPPIQGRHTPLSKSIKKDADLKKEYETNPIARQVLDQAIHLEGTIRNHGVHAAGVVIAPGNIVDYAPLEMSQKGVVATQYSMNPIEDLGLLKMDFLGLSNLTIINNAQRIIRKVYQKEIQLSDIPMDDIKTFELLQRGDSTGVFQLESAGMKRYLRELKPTVFDDIIAMVALYRPGPMQFIDDFIKRKHGINKITYLHEKMSGALENTYGVLVYQEQVMQISKDLCGFSGGEADTLRKGVAKKIPEVLAKMKLRFIEGGIAHSSADQLVLEKFWKQLEDFAAYCFNKSHAACYGLIAYWTAYLKAHYPDAFMAALMTSDYDNIDRLSIEINECRHMGLAVLLPDVNESYLEFGVVANASQIRFGLNAVKGVGTAAAEAILAARENGPFKSVEDFARRVPLQKVNRRAWESLIRAGAFDDLADRSDLLFNIDTILSYASKLQKETLSGQTDLFGGLQAAVPLPSVKLESAPAVHSHRERLTWERELLGLYVSAHPLDAYESYFTEQTVPLRQLSSELEGQTLQFGGIISSNRVIVTKSGSKMAFVRMEDKTSEGEVIVFPKLYATMGDKLSVDTVVRVKGKVSGKDRDGSMLAESKIIADELTVVSDHELDSYQKTGKAHKSPKARQKLVAAAAAQAPAVVYAPIEESIKKIFIHIKNPDDNDRLLKMKQMLNLHPGESEIILVLGEGKTSAIRLPFRAEASENLQAELTELYGATAVALR